MKLTYGEIERSSNNIFTGEIGPYSRFRDLAKPINTAKRMKAITRSFQEHVKDLLELRDELLQKHGTLNEDGTQYDFEDGGVAFRAEYGQLLKCVVEIPGERIRLSQLLSSTAISDADLETLEWLIDDGETERIDPIEPVIEDTASNEVKNQAMLESDEASDNVLDLGEDLASRAAA